VCWYQGTGDASLHLSFCAAVRADPSETGVEFVEDSEDGGRGPLSSLFGSAQTDPSAVGIAINEHLPDGIRLVANLPALKNTSYSSAGFDALGLDKGSSATSEGESEPLLAADDGKATARSGSGPGGSSGSGGGDFQGQLLKFNRINAHLANERTYLAWARTVMSVLSVTFSLKTESADAYSKNWRIVWFVLSCVFMGSANYTWFNGWTRYVRVKEVCTIVDVGEAERQMARDGVGFARLRALTVVLAILLVCTTVLYWGYGVADELYLATNDDATDDAADDDGSASRRVLKSALRSALSFLN
jgi:uncharacterized membrane protein YidH (DUF202 family)